MLGSLGQRDAGVPSTPCGPRPSQGWGPYWEHPWVQGGATGSGLGPTLVLSPQFCQAPGEEKPPARGGMRKQPTGSWVRRGELGPPRCPAPAAGCPPPPPPGPGPWHMSIRAHVHPVGHASPRAGRGRGGLGDADGASLLHGLGVSPRASGRVRSRDGGGFGGARLCAGVGMGDEIPGDVPRSLLLKTELARGQPWESGGAVRVWGALSALGQRSPRPGRRWRGHNPSFLSFMLSPRTPAR